MLLRNIITLSTAVCLSHLANATTEVLYITDGDANDIQAIQGNVIIDENLSMPGGRAYAIVVRDTIWTAAYAGSEPTRVEFDTALVPTGTSGAMNHPPGSDGAPEYLDGATDGVDNYTIDDGNGIVYRYNFDWSGSPAVVFTATCDEFCPGITYDSVNDSFWIVSNTAIYEYSAPTGALRSSFAHLASAGGLAYEGSTDTLWLVSNDAPHDTLRQFSKAGALLDTVTTTTSYSNNVWGAEFRVTAAAAPAAAPAAPVPLFSHWGLMLLSALLVTAGGWQQRRRKFRKS